MTFRPKSLADCVVPGAPGESIDFWIYSAAPKPQWQPRIKGSLTRADHPGSAIKYQDKLYELMSAEEIVQGRYNLRYGLREWDSAYAVRTLVSYTPEAEAAAQAVQRDETEKLRLRSRILWLLPLAGLAPAPVQNQWSEVTGLNMGWISAGSALILLGVALTLSAVTQQGSILRPLAFYLAVESFLRFLLTAVFRQPWGSPLVALPYYLSQIVTRRQTGTSQADAARFPSIMQDEVLRRPGETSLRVRSPFYDTDLTGDTPVRIEGVFYKPRYWHKQGKGLQRRWLYELDKLDAPPSGRWHEYTSPRTPLRQKAVEDYTRAYDLAHSFGLFWGIYPRREQVRLQLLYEYEAAKSTAISAGIFLAVGILQIVILSSNKASAPTMAGAAYLILESVYRIFRAQVFHEPAGSIVGYFFRLMIHPPK